MNKLLFTTRYKQKNMWYAAHVFAYDEEHAEEILIARRRGEEIVSEGSNYYQRPDSWETLQGGDVKDIDRIHYLTYLAHAAMVSGVAPDIVIGDKGWLHEYVHTLADSDEPLNETIETLTADITRTERALGFII